MNETFSPSDRCLWCCPNWREMLDSPSHTDWPTARLSKLLSETGVPPRQRTVPLSVRGQQGFINPGHYNCYLTCKTTGRNWTILGRRDLFLTTDLAVSLTKGSYNLVRKKSQTGVLAVEIFLRGKATPEAIIIPLVELNLSVQSLVTMELTCFYRKDVLMYSTDSTLPESCC